MKINSIFKVGVETNLSRQPVFALSEIIYICRHHVLCERVTLNCRNILIKN